MGRDPSQSAMCLWSEIALQDNEEKGEGSIEFFGGCPSVDAAM